MLPQKRYGVGRRGRGKGGGRGVERKSGWGLYMVLLRNLFLLFPDAIKRTTKTTANLFFLLRRF